MSVLLIICFLNIIIIIAIINIRLDTKIYYHYDTRRVKSNDVPHGGRVTRVSVGAEGDGLSKRARAQM